MIISSTTFHCFSCSQQCLTLFILYFKNPNASIMSLNNINMSFEKEKRKYGVTIEFLYTFKCFEEFEMEIF